MTKEKLKEVLYKNNIKENNKGNYNLSLDEIVSIWNTAIEAAHKDLVDGIIDDEHLGKLLQISDMQDMNQYIYKSSIKDEDKDKKSCNYEDTVDYD